ncbi:DEAD/DEAH box helicase [Aspergillus heterothallicus]
MAKADDLQKWFESLDSRTLDLVGDYAGDELFLIEGDSLLLQCFSDSALDFSTGLPLLHATSIVEKFLASLHRRRCVFHVVFFTDHSRVCIPAHSSAGLWPKYLLSREVILQHLMQNLKKSSSRIQIECFDNYLCPEFQQYLRVAGAYFVMCHDGTTTTTKGASPIPSSTTEDDDEKSTKQPPKRMLRRMIQWFVSQGYNISILNSLECRDTKVMSMILEGSASQARKVDVTACDFKHTPETSESAICELSAEQYTIDAIHAIARSEGMRWTQRELATLLTLSMLPQSVMNTQQSISNTRAMLLHTAILADCKLSERAVAYRRLSGAERFLEDFAASLHKLLTSDRWKYVMAKAPYECNLADVVDGRLFVTTACALQSSHNIPLTFGRATLDRFDVLALALFTSFNIDVRSSTSLNSLVPCQGHNDCAIPGHKTPREPANIVGGEITVLPFNNPVIDTHLQPVLVQVSAAMTESPSKNMSRVSKELSHWHNHRRPLDNRLKSGLTEWQKMRMNRRNQWFMAETLRYAASLTNAVGGSLNPESVFVKDPKARRAKQTTAKETTSIRPATEDKKHRKQERGNGKGKSVRKLITAQQKARQQELFDRHLAFWKNNIQILERLPQHVVRYIKAGELLSNLSGEKRSTLRPEILAYMVSTLFKEVSHSHHREASAHLVPLLWHTILRIANLRTGVTEDIASAVQDTIRVMKLPEVNIRPHEKRLMSFEFAQFPPKINETTMLLSTTEFQLLEAGPYLDRSMGSAPDSRVQDFEPDKWQREVLDEIDARRSLFVVAPTSAGKTFISFYAMKQILEDDNDGVLIYVAPTKALVNQIAAEIQARFSKSYNNAPGKSVWAIHTRDYRINNPTGCQILITVPHILQIMLLAPSNAKTWSPRVRRIIFDEVHCIGQGEDGLIWEQLLLLAPCPIIALSATIGNPAKFREWLEITQKANGHELIMIEHKARYSDLRKYVYHPPANFAFNGLPSAPQLAPLGLDACPSMAFLHPVASLIDRSRGLPDDLTLEPRDCHTLWKSMLKHSTPQFPVDESLHPENALPHIIKKVDVIEWGTRLKEVFTQWISDNSSPFEAVVAELSEPVSQHIPLLQQVFSRDVDHIPNPTTINKHSILQTTLPLICSLHEQGALPALFFNYDRSKCESICDDLVTKLENAEKTWKESNPAWRKKLAKFEEWNQLQEKQRQTRARTGKKQKSKKGRRNDDEASNDEDDRLSKIEEAQLAGLKDSSVFDTFNPDAPVTGFHFADEIRVIESEFQEYATQLRARDVPERLIQGLRRGIGVHHSGLNRKYRQVCEMLFRKGYLRVVIATGTLALGINMPCKTVVFSGDSVFLTSLSFRQASGRAGRRGFDFLGNVVFQNISRTKICRLLSSKLPDLNGHFPLTTSLVLRLLTLLHESNGAPYAVRAINSILSCPRIYLGGDEAKHTVLHHLRFSIEYLRRNCLLSGQGAPLNFSGAVSHLYYTGNSAFAFHALLSEGYFHKLCVNIGGSRTETLQILMLVMSHLFGRYNLRPSILENWKSRDKSTSVVVLPALPDDAAKILDSHNQQTLSIYSAYVKTFINQHVKEEDSTLPLTRIKYGGYMPASDISSLIEFLRPTIVTSSFAALSGHRDHWNNITELCTRVRNGVWLEQSVIPHLQTSPEREGHAPLNAYLYDFYKHGNIHALATENKIRRGDLWFLLNDFSLVLATIVTSLENFLKLSPGSDPDLLDTTGCGDESLDDEFEAIRLDDPKTAANSMDLSLRPTPASNAAVRLPKKAKQPKVVENWDDSLSDDSDDSESSAAAAGHDKTPAQSNNHDINSSEEFLEDNGLMQVLRAFRILQEEFNANFKAIWA